MATEADEKEARQDFLLGVHVNGGGITTCSWVCVCVITPQCYRYN